MSSVNVHVGELSKISKNMFYKYIYSKLLSVSCSHDGSESQADLCLHCPVRELPANSYSSSMRVKKSIYKRRSKQICGYPSCIVPFRIIRRGFFPSFHLVSSLLPSFLPPIYLFFFPSFFSLYVCLPSF